MRNGFTLIEILIALVLFQIAMLALAATTVVAVRDLGAANRRTQAQFAAESRVALLRGNACAAATAGSITSASRREWWNVTTHDRVRVVTDSVEITLSQGRDTLAAAAWVYCGQ